MGEHDTVRARLRAAVRADDPWTALSALSALDTGQPGGLADAVEELYRSDADRAALRPCFGRLLRLLGEAGDELLLRLLAERPSLPTTAGIC